MSSSRKPRPGAWPTPRPPRRGTPRASAFPVATARARPSCRCWPLPRRMANAKAHGNYPALTHIMSCLFEGCLLDFDAGSQIESRYFAACVVSQVVQEHDRHAVAPAQRHQEGPVASQGHQPRPKVQEGRHPGRRHDGRGHRLCLGQGRHRRRAAGHDARERRQGQGLLARHSGQGHLARPQHRREA